MILHFVDVRLEALEDGLPAYGRRCLGYVFYEYTVLKDCKAEKHRWDAYIQWGI